MGKKKSRNLIEDVKLDSLLSQDEMEFLDILDERNDGETKEMEMYNALFYMISGGVSLSYNLKNRLKVLSEKLKFTPQKERKILNDEILDLILKLGKSNKAISSYVMDMYEYCEKIKRFWHNSSYEVYEYYYSTLKDGYLQKFKNSNEIDFLKSEYIYFLKLNTKSRIINSTHNLIKEIDELNLVNYFPKLNADNMEFFNIVTQKKLDYISNKILLLGYHIQLAKKENDIFINLISAKEKENEFDKLDELVLNKSQLPSFSLLERYELICKLGFSKKILNVETDKKEKNKLLAIVMDCSIDNARKLLDETYKLLDDKQKNKERKSKIEEVVDEFLFRNKINI